MVRPFGEIGSHRKHVLEWYRYSLRNIRANVPTDNLQIELWNTLRQAVRRNRNHKAGWYVRGLLEDLSHLNKYIVGDDIIKLVALKNKYTEQIEPAPEPLQQANKPISGVVVTENMGDESRREKKKRLAPIPGDGDLYRYLLRYYKIYGPTKTIPRKHIDELLRPLAIHERYCKILYRIEYRIAKGPPKVSINYTNAGQSRIWFIRSPFNRKARQSKKLTGIIIKARLRAQDNLDRFRECESKLFYAFQEAQWEYTLIHKQPCSRKFNDVVTQIKSGKSNDIPAVFIDWIKPILEDMDILNRINANTQRKFTESRDRLIDGKQYEYYKQLNQRLYKKRLERFLGLKAELPTTNPFTEEKNLGALLVKWRFLRPDQLVKVKS